MLEVVTGVVPFSNKDDIAVCLAVVLGRQMPERPKKFPSFGRDEANQLWGIVVDSCAHDASDRPSSATVRDRLQGIRRHSRQPWPDDVIINSSSNAAVNERGQPWNLGVPPDRADGDDKHDEYSGDNDYDEHKDVDDEEEKLKSNTTPAGRSEAARIPEALTGESLNLSRFKGFILASRQANVLLLNRAYFIVFPTIYVFDRHGTIYRVDNRDQYHEVDLRPSPNPPGNESIFQIDNITYWFDHTNRLWLNLEAGRWYPKKTYPNLTDARHEVACCAEQNRQATPSIGAPPNVTSPTTAVAISLHQNSTLDDDYLYQPLGSSPGQDEIDRWFDEFVARRRASEETHKRLSDIRCPLEECRKLQMRPQALRDHLYFHFGIKAYKCLLGCANAFYTKAARDRHVQSCKCIDICRRRNQANRFWMCNAKDEHALLYDDDRRARSFYALGSDDLKASERLAGGACSKEADVYALGMTLLETITRAVPFSNFEGDAAVCATVVVRRQMPKWPKDFPSFSPDGVNQLWAIVVDSCAHDSSDRPGSTTIRDRTSNLLIVYNSHKQLQGVRKHSRQPSPNNMITNSISNATVNEHGQPRTLSVPPDGTDEVDGRYGEHSGDNDHGELKDADDEKKNCNLNLHQQT
ncbi:hypothetical protein FRC12_005428 [Ceratobasidium sp. 428]|nr:hypothetical protein FRC12_005428 [Ceratobasidium sp. 428]